MPQFKLLEVIGVLVALAVLVGAITAAWKLADSKGYARGQAEANAAWQTRESKELAAANAMILIESDKARAAERKASIVVTQANDARRKADEAAKARIPVVASTVASGLGRMCEPAGDTASQGAGGGETRNATGTASGDNAGTRAEFLAAAGNFLSGEASRADEVVRLLSQAQAYIRTAQEVCQ